MSGFTRAATPNRSGSKAGRPLVFQLVLLCMGLLLPVILTFALLMRSYVVEVRDALGQQALQQARSLASGLDQELARLSAVLDTLADSSALNPLNLAVFSEEARTVQRRLGVGIRLGEGVDKVLFSTSVAGGRPVTIPPTVGPGISDLIQGGEVQGAFFLISRLLRHEGAPPRLLSLVVPATNLEVIFPRHQLPAGWIALVADENGVIMARSEKNESFIGHRFSPRVLARLVGQEGLWVTRNLAEERVIAAYRQASLTGWRAGVTLPVAQAEVHLWHSITLMAGASLALLLLALGLALFFARRIVRPVRALVASARRLGQGQAVGALSSRAPAEIAAVGAALQQAQEALARRATLLADSEAAQRRAVSAAGVGTWEWDAVTNRLTGSPGREVLYGRRPGDILHREAVIGAAHPDDREMINQAVDEALRPGGTGDYGVEFRVIWPDGQQRWLRSQGGPVERAPDGRVIRLAGVIMDVTSQHEAMEREKLLASEVDHRARNVLAVVQSILRLSRQGDPKQFAVVEGRIAALARAHTLLARDRWVGGELRQMLHEELAAYLVDGRILLHGPPILLTHTAVQPLAMVLHELLTNAAKYGALSLPEGSVTLDWSLVGEHLVLTWAERGGPSVPSMPVSGGFGGKLIEATLRGQLGGRVEWHWAAEGLSCRVSLPLERVLRFGGEPVAEPMQAPESQPATRSLVGIRVLVAEDEAVLAMELRAMLQDLGCIVIGPAATAEAAQRLASNEVVDIAVLDVNLNGQPSFPAADILLARRVPVVFATGYGELQGRAESHLTVLLHKPLENGALEAALRRLLPPEGPVADEAPRRRAG